MSTPDEEERAWREIVAHYGERPAVDPDPPPARRGRPQEAAPRDREREQWIEDEVPEADRFVPPDPPPPPLPRGLRLAAWSGLFGCPAVGLALVLVGGSLPTWLGVMLMAGFLAGFVYLVATMRNDRDGWDDGAVL